MTNEDGRECSEPSAHKIQTPGDHPKHSIPCPEFSYINGFKEAP